MGSVCIGIDFGTTKTLVSYYDRHRGEARILRLGRGRDDIPTSMYAGEKKAFLFGEDADDMISTEPLRYARAFKLKLGSPTPILGFYEDEWVEYTAEELTAEYLRNIRLECEKVLSAEIESVVITRPVRFSPVQCEQLEKAARAAGLPAPRFISEPEAAAHAFCRQNGGADFHNALVVDWGGGTLDMSLVTRRDDRVETYRQYTDGVLRGGENFDEALLDHIEKRIDEECERGSELKSELENIEFGYTIRQKIRAVKESLSKLQQVPVRLSGRKGLYPDITITRDKFVSLISDDVHRAAMQAKQLIASIGDAALKPELIILVGGSSRIPAISEMLSRETGLPCRTWDMSMEAVGTGAALVAQMTDTPDEKGDNTPLIPNDIEALKRAAEQGNAGAQYKLGICYDEGRGVAQSYTEAVKWYKRAVDAYKQAAMQGDADAQKGLGVCYDAGRGVEQSYTEAVKWYKMAAEQGNAEAQYNLGYYFEIGRGVSQSSIEAVKWYRLSAEQGNAAAQCNLGWCYANGRGVSQSSMEAVKWYRLSAEQGNVAAQYNLGVCYAKGQGVAQSDTEAMRWYKMAAEQGNAETQYKVALYYREMREVAQNEALAYDYLQHAAQSGYAPAQSMLGWWYIEKETEDNSAVEWYRKAAARGDYMGQYNLGLCYENGRGVVANSTEAAEWSRKAEETRKLRASEYDTSCCVCGKGDAEYDGMCTKCYLDDRIAHADPRYKRCFKYIREKNIYGNMLFTIRDGVNFYGPIYIFCCIPIINLFPLIILALNADKFSVRQYRKKIWGKHWAQIRNKKKMRVRRREG